MCVFYVYNCPRRSTKRSQTFAHYFCLFADYIVNGLFSESFGLPEMCLIDILYQ